MLKLKIWICKFGIGIFVDLGLLHFQNNMEHLAVSVRNRAFYPRDAMLALLQRRVCLSVCLSHAGIVPSRAKAGS